MDFKHPSLPKRGGAGVDTPPDDYVPVPAIPYPVTKLAQLELAPQRWMFDKAFLATKPSMPIVDTDEWLSPDDVKKTEWYQNHPLNVSSASRLTEQNRQRSASKDTSAGSRSAPPQQRTLKRTRSRSESQVPGTIVEEDETQDVPQRPGPPPAKKRNTVRYLDNQSLIDETYSADNTQAYPHDTQPFGNTRPYATAGSTQRSNRSTGLDQTLSGNLDPVFMMGGPANDYDNDY